MRSLHSAIERCVLKMERSVRSVRRAVSCAFERSHLSSPGARVEDGVSLTAFRVEARDEALAKNDKSKFTQCEQFARPN